MIYAKSLSVKQNAVKEDLFVGAFEEEGILQKNKLSRNLYDNWLADETFACRLDKQLAREHRRSEFILAGYTRVAVSNLMRLTGCSKPETARKACLDMITMRTNDSALSCKTPGDNPILRHESQILSPEIAGKLLASLAEEKKN